MMITKERLYPRLPVSVEDSLRKRLYRTLSVIRPISMAEVEEQLMVQGYPPHIYKQKVF